MQNAQNKQIAAISPWKGALGSPGEWEWIAPSATLDYTWTPSEPRTWNFPGSPVVKTSPSNAGSASLIPGQRTKIPYASQPKKQSVKEKDYCNKFNKDFKNGPHQKISFKKEEPVLTSPGHGGLPPSPAFLVCAFLLPWVAFRLGWGNCRHRSGEGSWLTLHLPLNIIRKKSVWSPLL